MLSFVPTPIGNIGDISLRALELLAKADILLCEDTRVTKKLLHILQERYDFFKPNPSQDFYSVHSHNERQFLQQHTKEFFCEHEVVYISDAGMPGISDPGATLIQYAQQEGIAYDVLPGANAVLTAYVASGFDDAKMFFYGFLDHKGSSREAQLQEVLFSGYTSVVYESPHRLEKLLKELHASVPTRKLFLAKELTKRYQCYFKGTAQEILTTLDGNFKGEWVVVIEADVRHNSSAISQEDILALDLPKKQQAKLISKITGEKPKEVYNRLLEL